MQGVDNRCAVATQVAAFCPVPVTGPVYALRRMTDVCASLRKRTGEDGPKSLRPARRAAALEDASAAHASGSLLGAPSSPANGRNREISSTCCPRSARGTGARPLEFVIETTRWARSPPPTRRRTARRHRGCRACPLRCGAAGKPARVRTANRSTMRAAVKTRPSIGCVVFRPFAIARCSTDCVTNCGTNRRSARARACFIGDRFLRKNMMIRWISAPRLAVCVRPVLSATFSPPKVA